MLTEGILNPQLRSLIARVRHTNTLVIADYAFPYWPQIETIDLSLVQGVPTVIQLLDAILPAWKCGEIFMAEEFNSHNPKKVRDTFEKARRGVKTTFEPHLALKQRVPGAIGLIRTGDNTIYSNMVLVSS
ncbi:MAG TPA: RbsD/FucU domain-containing protein [Verrucomicrobiae bacterium]